MILFFTIPSFAQLRPVYVPPDVMPPPITFQIVTTAITIAAFFGLANSVSGWRHLLVVPLWIILWILQFTAWFLPNDPWLWL